MKVIFKDKDGEQWKSQVYKIVAQPVPSPNPLNPKAVSVSIMSSFLVYVQNKFQWVNIDACTLVDE